MDERDREVSSGARGEDSVDMSMNVIARGVGCKKGIFQTALGKHCKLEDGAEGQNRTGYAGLFRAALYQ